MSIFKHDIALHGWTPVDRDATNIFKNKKPIHKVEPLSVEDVQFPRHDPVVAKVEEYAKKNLNKETYNHSMRVFYFGMTIIKQQFPEYAASLSPSTYALTCLLHDIGTSSDNLQATFMSFEFYGGLLALNLIKDELKGPQLQAEAVCEAIIRHQDLGTVGTITFLGQVIQLATLHDNAGDFPELTHRATRDDVNDKFPRLGWCGCFEKVIREEKRLKPWCHTTHVENFEDQVLGNTLMKKYEEAEE